MSTTRRRWGRALAHQARERVADAEALADAINRRGR